MTRMNEQYSSSGAAPQDQPGDHHVRALRALAVANLRVLTSRRSLGELVVLEHELETVAKHLATHPAQLPAPSLP